MTMHALAEHDKPVSVLAPLRLELKFASAVQVLAVLAVELTDAVRTTGAALAPVASASHV
jgi:hypothetical protein